MRYTLQQLEELRFNLRDIPGWFSIVEKCEDFNKRDIEMLELLDEHAIKFNKEVESLEYELKQKYKKSLEEWKLEMTEEELSEIKEARLEFLRNKITKLELLLEEIWINYQESSDNDVPYFLRRAVLEINNPWTLEKRIKSFTLEKLLIEFPNSNLSGGVSSEEILKANNVPFSELIAFNKRKAALCPFHSEKIPSFYLMPKNNKCHCFGCGWTGNIIEFIMKKDNLSFINAVKYLIHE